MFGLENMFTDKDDGREHKMVMMMMMMLESFQWHYTYLLGCRRGEERRGERKSKRGRRKKFIHKKREETSRDEEPLPQSSDRCSIVLFTLGPKVKRTQHNDSKTRDPTDECGCCVVLFLFMFSLRACTLRGRHTHAD